MTAASPITPIEQRHRIQASLKIIGTDEKAGKIRKLILDGMADDHPSVQAAAFYGQGYTNDR